MRADELTQRMWDEDVVDIADQNKRLTMEEVLAVRKEAQSRRYGEGLPGAKLSNMFLCAIAFPQLSCAPGSRSDGNFLTSYHGQERRRVPPLPVGVEVTLL